MLPVSDGLTSSEASSAAFRTKPSSPGGVTCSSVTNDSITVNVEVPNQAANTYIIDGYTANGSSQIPGFGGNISGDASTSNNPATISFDFLTAGVKYDVYVWSVSAGLLSDNFVKTECLTQLNPAESVSVQSANISSLTVLWQKPAGYYNGFSVLCDGQDVANTTTQELNTTAGDNNSPGEINCTQLISGALYLVTVTTYLFQSSIAATSAPTYAAVEPRAANFQVVGSTSSSMSIIIEVLPAGTFCTNYSIKFQSSTVSPVYSMSCDSGTNEVNFIANSSLTGDTNYSVQVTTVSDYLQYPGSIPAYSAISSENYWTVPNSVTNTELSDVTQNSAIVKWDLPQKHDHLNMIVINIFDSSWNCGRQIRLDCSSTQAPPSCGTVTQISYQDCSETTNYTIGNLNADTLYIVIVLIGNPGGFSVNTTYGFVTTLTNPDMSWIAGVVIGIVVIIGIFIAVFYFYRRKQKDEKRRSRSDAYNNIMRPSLNDSMERDVIRLQDLDALIQQMKKNSDAGFMHEFDVLNKNSPAHSTAIAKMPENMAKNRFTNILPFDRSLVPLPQAELYPTTYINANFIPGQTREDEYIATQGPLEDTVVDFWRLIFEHNVPVIVMLTELVERSQEKCYKYWPDTTEMYGSIYVSLTSEVPQESVVIRRFHIVMGAAEHRTIQYHFKGWPDFGVPASPEPLLRFIRLVRSTVPYSYSNPFVVHCSAGVGRTGTFITIDRLLQHMQANNTVDIFGTVKSLRNNRQSMVQSEAQYIFIYECVNYAYIHGYRRSDNEYANVTRVAGQDNEIYANVPSKRIEEDVVDPVYVNFNIQSGNGSANGTAYYNRAYSPDNNFA